MFFATGKQLNVRVLQKIRFPILFQLKGFVHWVGKHEFS